MPGARHAQLMVAVVCLAATAAAQESPRKDRYGDPLPDGAIARLTSLRYRTGDCDDRILPMHDGRHVIALGPNKIAHYDMTNGLRVRWAKPLSDESDRIGAAAVSPDDGTLIFDRLSRSPVGNIATEEHALIRWNLRTDVRERAVPFDSAIRMVAFVRGGKCFVTLDAQSRLRVFDAATMEPAAPWSPSGPPIGLIATDPGGTYLVVATLPPRRAPEIQIWKTDTLTIARSLKCDSIGVESMTFSADARFLAVNDGLSVSVYDLFTGQRIAKLSPGFKSRQSALDRLCRVAVSPNGDTITACSTRGDLDVWSGLTGSLIASWPVRCAGHVTFQWWNEDSILASGGSDLTVWDVRRGVVRRGQSGHRGEIEFMTFTEAGRSIRTERSLDATWTWSATDGAPLAHQPDDRFRPAIVWAASDRQCAVIKQFQNGRAGLALRQAAPPSTRPMFATDQDDVLDASVGGRCVATFRTGEVRFWNGVTGELLSRVKFGKLAPLLRLAPNGEMALMIDSGATNNVIRLVRTRDGAHLRDITISLGDEEFFVPTYDRPVFSPDGRRAALASYQGILLIEVSSGQVCGEIRGAHPTTGDGGWFSPDGRYLLMAQRADVGAAGLYLCDPWRTLTARRLILPDWKRGDLQVAFTPDGERFATSNSGGLLWDAAALTEVVPTKRPCDGLGLWNDLGGEARGAAKAMGPCLCAPDETVAFLRTMLRPSAPLPADRLKIALANLDHPAHSQREKASKELQEFGWNVVGALRDHLANKPPAEGRSRVERIITGLEREAFRADRALELLELIGTPAARALLAELAQGASTAPFTQAAKAGVARIDARRASVPEK